MKIISGFTIYFVLCKSIAMNIVGHFRFRFAENQFLMACFGIIVDLQASVSTRTRNVFSPISGTEKECARILIGDYIMNR